MPQIEQLDATFASQIFWLLVTFGLVFVVVGLGMVPKVQGTVEARDQQIAGDLRAAEAARAEADAAEETWRQRENASREQARAVLAKAREAAVKSSEASLATANASTNERLSAEEARIRTATDSALGEIEAVAADAARQIVARLTGTEPSAAEAKGAVKAAIHG